jgi:ketosteroid isomerase-like protein
MSDKIHQLMNAIETVNAHYRVIIEKDIAAICAKYYPAEDTYVVLEGPRLTTIGFERISKGWTDFCASSLKLLSIEWTEGPFAEETSGMAWVSGIIRLRVEVNGAPFENIFRASFVLLPTEGGWKIRHEHVSIAHPDPYGIGDWLRK